MYWYDAKVHEFDSYSDDIINYTNDDDSIAAAVRDMRAHCDSMMDKISSTLFICYKYKNSTSRSNDDVLNLFWHYTSR